DLVRKLCEHHAPKRRHAVTLNLADPDPGLNELSLLLEGITSLPPLKFLPPHVEREVRWLSDDDVIATRVIMSEVDQAINANRLRYIDVEMRKVAELVRSDVATRGVHHIEMVGGTITIQFVRTRSLWKRLFG